MEGRHYDEMRMSTALSGPVFTNLNDVKHAIEWYNDAMKRQEHNKAMENVRGDACLAGWRKLMEDSAYIDFDKEMLNDSNYNKEKGGNGMLKYVYHVILFNTDTEKIDFKGYLPAQSTEAALMAAAQTFGKYDADVYVHNVKLIMQYEKK
jgi:hypothetical protein